MKHHIIPAALQPGNRLLLRTFTRRLSSHLRLMLILAMIPGITAAQLKKNVNTKPYPLGNPVITHMYTADASPHVMPDGRVWMVTSVDHEDGGGYSTMHSYHSFSSADMVNWTDHGEILNVYDVMGSDTEPEGEDWALWAPDVVYYRGEFFLYFPIRILHTDTVKPDGGRVVTSYIAVAWGQSLEFPMTVINPRIEGTRGIDPAVFIDDDGEKYLYFGSHWGGRLKDNMKELEGDPVQMDVNDKGFMEAIWMNKRDGKYYVSYHTHYDKPIDPENPDDPERRKSRLDYGISDHPLGPFKYTGIMNYELGVNVDAGPKLPGREYVPWRLFQSNHGGIVEFHGQEYLFYHTSALSSWRQDEFKGPGTWTQRSVCIDKLNYDPDGTIIPVRQTIEGVDPVEVDQPSRILLDVGKSTSNAFSPQVARKTRKGYEINRDVVIKFPEVDLGTGYYYFGVTLMETVDKGKIELRLDREDGLLVGTIPLASDSRNYNCCEAETFLRNANGVHDVYLVITRDHGGKTLKIEKPVFFAGAPTH